MFCDTLFPKTYWEQEENNGTEFIKKLPIYVVCILGCHFLTSSCKLSSLKWSYNTFKHPSSTHPIDLRNIGQIIKKCIQFSLKQFCLKRSFILEIFIQVPPWWLNIENILWICRLDSRLTVQQIFFFKEYDTLCGVVWLLSLLGNNTSFKLILNFIEFCKWGAPKGSGKITRGKDWKNMFDRYRGRGQR